MAAAAMSLLRRCGRRASKSPSFGSWTHATLRRSSGLQGRTRFFSEETAVKPGEIGEVSGIPENHLRRKVVIYNPARTAMQQGEAFKNQWRIRFESNQKWENPLMGWTSTGDPLSYVGDAALSFDSKEAAEHFVLKHGWDYTVVEPKEAKKKTKAYADNFKWRGPPEE